MSSESNRSSESSQEKRNNSTPSEDMAAEPPRQQEGIFRESDAGDGSKREEQYLQGTKLVLCIISLFLCLFLVALDQTIVVTILTEVGNQFNGFDKIGWLSSGFLLSIAVLVAAWGKLSIIFGRKATMYVAIVLFEAGSLMCALASSMDILIGGRVLAGVGGGGIQSMVFIILTEIVPIQQRPLSMALIGCTFAVASVLGPLVGGAFTSHVTWRWCFYINLPIGGVALVFLYFAFNPPRPKGDLKDKLKMIDYFGTFLLTSGLVVFLLALTFGAGNKFSWRSAAVISCFVIGGAVIIIFCIWNFRYSKIPIIPLNVVVIPQVDAAAITFFAVFGFFMATILYISVYFQVIHGSSAWNSGVHLLPVIIPVVLCSIVGGIAINKTRYVKPISVFGGILGPIGCGLLTLLEVNSSSSKQIGLLILVGVSIGFQMQPSIIASQISAPKTPGGTILTTTFVTFARALGGAIGADLADTVYSASFQNSFQSAISHESNEAIVQELSKLNIKSFISSTEIIATLTPQAQLFIKEQIMHAIRDVFYMALGFSCLAFISGLFITNKRLPAKSIE